MKLRQSAIGAHQMCPRKYNLAYRENLSLKVEDTNTLRNIGTLFHRKVEMYLGSTKFSPEDKEKLAIELAQIEPKNAEMLDSIMHRYTKWVEEFKESHELVELECNFEKEVLPGFTLTGRVDQIWRSKVTGQLILIDLKTVGSRNQAPRENDGQLMRYAWLLEPLEPITVAHLSVLRVTKPRTGDTIRYSKIFLTPDDVKLFYKETLLPQVKTILMQNEIGFYPCPGRHCGYMCDYQDLCIAMDRPDEDVYGILNRDYYIRDDE